MFIKNDFDETHGLRCVDMCMYIDNTVYTEERDEYKTFEYLRTIVYILSRKKRMFSTIDEYKEFSLFCANIIYLRLTNKRQFLAIDDVKRIDKIKSILNYIKGMLRIWQIQYKEMTSTEVFDESSIGLEGCWNLGEQLRQDIVNYNSSLLRIDIEIYIKSLPKLIWEKIKETPFASDKRVKYNLYISCLLSFLRMITLSNTNKEKLYNKKTGQLRPHADTMLGDMILDEQVNSIITWHLSNEFKSVVTIILNNVKETLSKDIKEFSIDHSLQEESIEEILMSPLAQLKEE